MKKIYLILIALPFLFQSCLMEDKNIFPESAAERMNAALKHHQEILMGATNGWVMEYFPEKKQSYGGYTMFVKFEAHDKVTVASELGKADQTESSMYQIISDSGPVLTFNTHNSLFHYFSEPKNPDGIGPGDSGMGGDYEFLILESTPEKVTMKGKKTGNRIIMIPIAGGASWDGMMKEYQVTASKIKAKRFNFTMGETQGSATASYRTLDFTYPGANNAVEVVRGSFRVLPADEVEFYEPLKIGSQVITKMKLSVDANDLLHFTDASSGLTLIEQLPALNDLLVSGNWYFKYSEMGKFGQDQWDLTYKVGLTPTNRDIYFAYLGTNGNFYGFCFAGVENNQASAGVLLYEYKLIGGDQITFTFAASGAGVGVDYYQKSKLYYMLEPIAESKPRTFTLTADNPKVPTLITLQDNSEPTNTITLSNKEILWPYYDE